MSYILYQQMMKAANDGNRDGHNPFLLAVIMIGFVLLMFIIGVL
jgi:hypothetical protein